MSKSKKYIYPFIFSMFSFLYYIISVMTTNAIFKGDYAGMGIAFIVLAAWIVLAIPCHCIVYGKIIREEKLKFLFAVYNPLVITFCYTSPFFAGANSNSFGVILKIAIFLFIWVALWTFIPLLIRLNSAKKQDNNHSSKTQTECA